MKVTFFTVDIEGCTMYFFSERNAAWMAMMLKEYPAHVKRLWHDRLENSVDKETFNNWADALSYADMDITAGFSAANHIGYPRPDWHTQERFIIDR